MKKALVIILSVLCFFISCGNDNSLKIGTIEKGTKGGECYPNNTCNEGLLCIGDICVLETEDADTTETDSDKITNDELNDEDVILIDEFEDLDIIDDIEILEDGEILGDETTEDSDSITDEDLEETPDWDIVGWTKYNDLYWSEASSETMSFENANTYCANMGARVPTINELRGISTCANSMVGGLCEFTDICTIIPDCWSHCDVMCEIIEGKLYNIFNDNVVKLGASTMGEENTSGNTIKYNIYINFMAGQIAKTDDYNKLINFRCVR